MTVEIVVVAATGQHVGRRHGAQLFIEDTIAQELRGFDLGGGLRQAKLEIADRQRGGNVFLVTMFIGRDETQFRGGEHAAESKPWLLSLRAH